MQQMAQAEGAMLGNQGHHAAQQSPPSVRCWLQFAPLPPGLTLIRQRLHPL